MLRCCDGKLHLVWSCEWKRVTEREGLERGRESGLSCCLAENWTEEGELKCGCPHIIILNKNLVLT